MQFIIVTGLSGAGKSLTANVLEDLGFYCVDNMPPKLIPKFAELCLQSGNNISKVAIVVDVRTGKMWSGLFEGLDGLKEQGFDYKILFLDAENRVLINRFKETRRKHPLFEDSNYSIEEALELERETLNDMKERADYIFDTSLISPSQLRENLSLLFGSGHKSSGLMISCESFGFKYGLPREADLVFDVRFMPNPFYLPELKLKTGLDREVSDYVMNTKQAAEFKDKLFDMIEFLIPHYEKEGKSQLVIAIGCTGGKHRSVTFAQLLYSHLEKIGYRVSVIHRDIQKI